MANTKRKEATMSNQSLHCDLVLPQGAHSELAGSDAVSGWRTIEEMASLAERLGYRGVWAYDRVEPLPRRAPLPVFYGWTTLTALARSTDRLKLGLISAPAPARDPVLLAKQAACLDVISGGRLMLALDSAYLSEHRIDAAAARQGATETAQALRQLWSGDLASFQGECVQFESAYCHPGPRQDRLPLLALGAPETTAAQSAFDTVIYQEDPASVRRRVDALIDQQLASEGSAHWAGTAGGSGGSSPRASTEVRPMVMLDCRIFDTNLDRDRWLASPHVIIFWSDHPDVYVGRNLIGTPDAVRAQLQRYVDAGVRDFAIYFRDYPASRSAERFMTEVVPQLDLESDLFTGDLAAELASRTVMADAG
jgi:alkanesulfonate monooxygenase SsuD/methylene tetrahydromethanopterin reductase-like flavin-dependent oxidoreductase (luciferase family)